MISTIQEERKLSETRYSLLKIRVLWLKTHICQELLRGSGQTVARPVATALGVNPGEQRTFEGTHATVKVTWRLSATKGPSVGSLRLLATDAGAQLGDELVIVFHVDRRSVSTERIEATASLPQRLTALLGVPASDPRSALARSLSCPAHDVASVLASRGDTALVAALDTKQDTMIERTDGSDA